MCVCLVSHTIAASAGSTFPCMIFPPCFHLPVYPPSPRKNASTAVSFGGCPPLVASPFLSRSSLMRFHVAGSTHSLSVGTYHGLDRRYAATSLLNFFRWLQYQCASAVVPVLFSFLSIFGLLPELLVGWYMNPDMFMDFTSSCLSSSYWKEFWSHC